MVSLKIEDVRQFTSKLFVGEAFDRFLLREAEIVTYNTFSIDGRIRPGYYTSEEVEENHIGSLSSWRKLKPVCFSLIKGKKLPGSFAIVLQLSPEDTESFLTRSHSSLRAEQVNGLYVNIRYEGEVLRCVSGTSVNFFTMDKSLDAAWEESLKKFLKKNQIAYIEE